MSSDLIKELSNLRSLLIMDVPPDCLGHDKEHGFYYRDQAQHTITKTIDQFAAKDAEIEKLRREVKGLKEFITWLWLGICNSECGDEFDIQDKLQELGLIVEVPADAAFKEEWGDECDTMFVTAWSKLAPTAPQPEHRASSPGELDYMAHGGKPQPEQRSVLDLAKESVELNQAWLDEHECDCTMDGGVHCCGRPNVERVVVALRAALKEAGEVGDE